MIASLIVWLNRVFRRPNVAGRESAEAYSRWEHELGRGLVQDYLEPAGDLSGRIVLDVGCGGGGKTVAYHEAGAALVVGTDILVENIEASRRYARANAPGLTDAFFASDAAQLPLVDHAFDTVVANDAMEHFAQPERAVVEMARATRNGGSIWVFFTPHFSPLGSHLYDYVHTPWCHLLFTRAQLRGAIGKVLARRGVSPGEREVELTEIMRSYDEDLNHMSIGRFLGIVRRNRGLRIDSLELRPAKFRFLRPLTRIPLVRELFTGVVVCRLERVS